MDVKKFNLNFNGKTASEIIDFGFVITEVDGKKLGMWPSQNLLVIS